MVQIAKPVLCNLPIFGGFDEQMLRILASRLQPRRYPPGHDICHQGHVGEHFWILAEGQVRSLHLLSKPFLMEYYPQPDIQAAIMRRDKTVKLVMLSYSDHG